MIFGEWYFRAREYAKFSPREQKELLISSILWGFVFSFRLWGGDSFNLTTGLVNWFIVSLLVAFAAWWHIIIQKIFSLSLGYRTHYYWWFQGLIGSLILIFLSYGHLPFIVPGFTFYEHMKGLRLGKFRHGINKKDLVVPAVAGPFSNVVLALLASFFYVGSKNPMILLFMKINFLYGFMTLIPLPRLKGIGISEGASSGLHIFFYNRPLYAFTLVSLLAYAGLVFLAATAWQSFFLLVLALVLGLGGMAAFAAIFNKT